MRYVWPCYTRCLLVIHNWRAKRASYVDWTARATERIPKCFYVNDLKRHHHSPRERCAHRALAYVRGLTLELQWAGFTFAQSAGQPAGPKWLWIKVTVHAKMYHWVSAKNLRSKFRVDSPYNGTGLTIRECFRILLRYTLYVITVERSTVV